MKRISLLMVIVLLASLLAACATPTSPAPTVTAAVQPTASAYDVLKPLATGFVDELAAGNFDAAVARFDSGMKTAMPAASLKTEWAKAVAAAGAFKGQKGTYTGESKGYRLVYVACDFANGPLDLRLAFNNQNQISGMLFQPAKTSPGLTDYTAPSYVNTSSFTELQVTIGQGQWALPGTFTLPNGPGPFPAVVLVHGAGANDRDETTALNKPFRDLAWGLASQGVAVLRYDKRNFIHADLFTDTVVGALTVQDEVIDDAILAVKLLQRGKTIDTKRIFVIGHGLGGMLAPRIAEQMPDVAGLVMLAAPSRPLVDTIYDQYVYLYSLNGGPTDQQKIDLETIRAQVDRANDPALTGAVPASELPLGIYPAYWIDLRSYDQVASAKALKIPLLILQGGRDYQVSPEADFKGWQTALAANANVSFKLYPAANYLFIPGTGPASPADYQKEGHVAAEVVSDIGQWILKH